eukprot:8744512-Pyramimonas_sp.AAC.1
MLSVEIHVALHCISDANAAAWNVTVEANVDPMCNAIPHLPICKIGGGDVIGQETSGLHYPVWYAEMRIASASDQGGW